MNDKLLTQLRICKLTDSKPNFSALSREYGIDRRTIKKYYDGYEGKAAHRSSHSKLDQYEAVIKQKFEIKGATFRSVYEYLLAKYGDSIGTYSNFRKYVVNRGIKPRKKGTGHPRFETAPGKQAQVDWKEDVPLHNRAGRLIIIQVFNYKLGYSRYCHFACKYNKTQQEVIDCLIDSFKDTGGVPETILFDNMGSIVTFHEGKRHVGNRIKQFAKDFGFNMRFARAKRPETKGKVESSNKFIEWLLVYDNDFEDEEELESILKSINKRINTQVNQSTGVPPVLLLQKEVSELSPLPADEVIESYRSYDRKTSVAKDSTVVFMNARYSVPPKYIGEYVLLKRDQDALNIYHDDVCIASHNITGRRINYREDDYRELLAPLVKNSDIDAIAEENLKQFDTLL